VSFACDILLSMSISYYHIDSFASELFAGNPAGVCLLPAFPVNDVMQKIRSGEPSQRNRFCGCPHRWRFRPALVHTIVEDDLCGHATLAAAYALSLRGHDTWPVRVHTISGLLTVHRDHERF
jgi:predicted PhzF superfamily epimerase YddE/YHI9